MLLEIELRIELFLHFSYVCGFQRKHKSEMRITSFKVEEFLLKVV